VDQPDDGADGRPGQLHVGQCPRALTTASTGCSLRPAGRRWWAGRPSRGAQGIHAGLQRPQPECGGVPGNAPVTRVSAPRPAVRTCGLSSSRATGLRGAPVSRWVASKSAAATHPAASVQAARSDRGTALNDVELGRSSGDRRRGRPAISLRRHSDRPVRRWSGAELLVVAAEQLPPVPVQHGNQLPVGSDRAEDGRVMYAPGRGGQ
jgi:hypothetical protein